MGYETTLLIGKSGHTSDEFTRGVPEMDGDEVYYPLVHDKDGEVSKTGTKETYFFVYATVDLCKCGHTSKVNSLDSSNTDKHHQWYWYEGGTERRCDAYGEKPTPIPLLTVVEALEKDYENGGYRRFKWALGLLNAMKEDKEDLEILLVGH